MVFVHHIDVSSNDNNAYGGLPWLDLLWKGIVKL